MNVPFVWLLAVAVSLGSVAPARPALAIVMSGATYSNRPPHYPQSIVPAGERAWDGVGLLNLYVPDPHLQGREVLLGNCTGTLVDPRFVLTAAHCFFGTDGTGIDRVTRADFFLLGTPGSNRRGTMSDHFIEPDYDSTVGHRVGGNDLALIELASPINGVPTYVYNSGSIENPVGTVFMVGFGRIGNGNHSPAEPNLPGDQVRRQAVNRVDWVQNDAEHLRAILALGQQDRGGTDCNDARQGYCSFIPPLNTLLLDFDRPPEAGAEPVNATDLVDQITNEPSYFVESDLHTAHLNEGMPASGDSGGPLFEFLDSDLLREHPILVGVVSSESDDESRFGSLAYYTDVSAFRDWIDVHLEAPEPPVAALLLAATLAGCLSRARHRPPIPARVRA